MKKSLMISVFILLFCAFTFQNFSDDQTTWERYFLLGQVGEDWAMTSCVAKDGNYLIAGYTKDLPNKSFVIKMTPTGDTLWARKFERDSVATVVPYSIVPTDDNGCIFGGSSDQLNLVKIDADGNLVWNNIYSEDQHLLRSIRRTKNGDFVATGYKYPFTSLIMRIDKNGNLIWNQTNQNFRNLGCFVETSDSGFIALAGTPGPLIIKLSKLGTIEWSKNVPAGYGPVVINKIGETEYLISGKGDFIMNEKGETISQFKIPLLPNEGSSAFLYSASTDEIRFMVKATFAWLPLTVNSRIILYDLNGTILSEKLIVDSNNNSREIRGITQLYDGYLFTGIRNFDTATEQTIAKSMVIKTDSLLNYKTVGVNDPSIIVPQTFKLYQNYPNPFNPTTNIKFSIPTTQYTVLKVFDALGREVATLVNENLTAGVYQYQFTTDQYQLPSGVYFYKLETDAHIEVKRMVLVK